MKLSKEILKETVLKLWETVVGTADIANGTGQHQQQQP